MQAIVAFAALRRVKRDDVIAWLDAGDTFADFQNDARALVAKNGREKALWVSARPRKFVGVTDTCRLDLDQNLTSARTVQIDIHNFQRLARSGRNRGTSAHDNVPPR